MILKMKHCAVVTTALAGLFMSTAGGLNAHADGVLKIGTPLALTGGLADEGKKQEAVWKLWLDKVTAAGGIMVGGEKMSVEFVKYLFGTLAPNTGMTESMVGYFKEKMPSLKKVAVYGRDDVFPKAMASALADSAKKGGLDVVYNELYSVGSMDHSAAVSAIKAASPDWIYMTGYTQDLILGRKQLQDLGVKAPIITMVTGPAYKEFTEGLGPLADGVTSSTWWHHATSYNNTIGPWTSTAAFYKDFVAKFERDPDYVHGSCAAAADVLVNAVQKAGSTDKKAVRDALAATDVLTFYGPIDFGDNGMNQGREMPIIQVQGDDIKVLYPASIADAQMKTIN